MKAIVPVETADQIETTRKLFREYEKWLGMDLCFQSFEEEMRDLPGKYAPPEGRLYLANIENDAVGCIALRKIGDGICEMKRLYLNDSARGQGLGNRLIEKIISDARSIGYFKMRLKWKSRRPVRDPRLPPYRTLLRQPSRRRLIHGA